MSKHFPGFSLPKHNTPSTETWSVLGSASKSETSAASSCNAGAKGSSTFTYEITTTIFCLKKSTSSVQGKLASET